MSTETGTWDIEIMINCKKYQHPRRGRHSEAPAPPRIPRITRLMALAIKFQDMVDRGEVHDYADLARLGYVSRARMTQIMNLLNLAPDIQESLLCGCELAPERPIRETHLRRLTAIVDWVDQRRLWKCNGGRING